MNEKVVLRKAEWFNNELIQALWSSKFNNRIMKILFLIDGKTFFSIKMELIDEKND